MRGTDYQGAPPPPSATGGQGGERRVALVIGNGAYKQPGATLRNPPNDARDVAAALTRLGFDLLPTSSGSGWHQDVDLNSFGALLARFAISAHGAEMAVLYYAGHGIEVDGTNYLVPISADLDHVGALKWQTRSLPDVLAALEGASKLRLLILDACRNNPFAQSMRGLEGVRSFGASLRQPEPPGNTLVFYAARHGTTAKDGAPGGNSPFATALLRHIEKPDLELLHMFGEVADDVRELTANIQEPYLYGTKGRALIYLKRSLGAMDKGHESPRATKDSSSELLAWSQSEWEKLKGRGDLRASEITLEDIERLSVFAATAVPFYAHDARKLVSKFVKTKLLAIEMMWTFREKREMPQADHLAMLEVIVASPAREYHAQAQRIMATIYVESAGDRQHNYDKARILLEEATAAGDAKAQVDLGLLYENDKWQLHDPAKSVDWYEKGAANGETYAMTRLGKLYEEGRGVPCDFEKAFEYYRRAAINGDLAGMGKLAGLYENGRGTLQDHASAREWYEKAIEKVSELDLDEDSAKIFEEKLANLNGPAKPNAASLPSRTFAVRVGTGANDTTVLLSPGEIIKDADFSPEMVLVPPGKFWMGSREGEGRASERPRHAVTIAHPLLVGKYPITFDEWDAFDQAEGIVDISVTEIRTESGVFFKKTNKTWQENRRKYTPEDLGWGRGRRPVINVSWSDALAYVKWLTKVTGKNYRLLSEAEWEYACKAGTETAYSFGETIMKSQAQFSEGERGSATHTVEVNRFPSNAFGLYDMHGNVKEWVEDGWSETYEGAPSNGEAVDEPYADRISKVVRGGSWSSTADELRSAFRGHHHANGRVTWCGFRVASPLVGRRQLVRLSPLPS